MSSCLKSAIVPAFANETDRLALLDFKNWITQDLLQIMSSWNDSIHFSNWLGVTCGPSSKRVMVLNLIAKKLYGFIPPSIKNLTCLTGINLQNHSFYSEIPQEVGRLQHQWRLYMQARVVIGPPWLAKKKCIYTLAKKILYAKLTYCDHPNKKFYHPDLRITKIWVQHVRVIFY